MSIKAVETCGKKTQLYALHTHQKQLTFQRDSLVKLDIIRDREFGSLHAQFVARQSPLELIRGDHARSKGTKSGLVANLELRGLVDCRSGFLRV